MDGAVGTVHVDATEGAHQQAADQCGDHVRDNTADHQPDGDDQTEQRERGAPRRRCRFIDFGGQRENEEVFRLPVQQADRLPGASDEQGVAHAQLFLQYFAGDGAPVAPQSHDVDTALRTHPQIEDRPADHPGTRRQGDFGQAEFARTFKEMLALERQGLQLHLTTEAVKIEFGVDEVDEQDVAIQQLAIGRGAQHVVAELALPLDGNDVGAVTLA